MNENNNFFILVVECKSDAGCDLFSKIKNSINFPNLNDSNIENERFLYNMRTRNDQTYEEIDQDDWEEILEEDIKDSVGKQKYIEENFPVYKIDPKILQIMEDLEKPD